MGIVVLRACPPPRFSAFPHQSKQRGPQQASSLAATLAGVATPFFTSSQEVGGWDFLGFRNVARANILKRFHFLSEQEVVIQYRFSCCFHSGIFLSTPPPTPTPRNKAVIKSSSRMQAGAWNRDKPTNPVASAEPPSLIFRAIDHFKIAQGKRARQNII